MKYFVLLVMTVISVSVIGQSLVINELMQSNVDCLWDDRKDFPDSWVELYNTGSEPVSLSAYQIGIKIDDGQHPVNAWQLPATVTVPAHGYQLVYCDKVGDGLHTDFRLESGKGCVVYLFRNGVLDELASVVDSLKKQPAPNIAYGRKSDGDSKWGYELTPTPGKANAGGVCKKDQILGEPLFSEPGSVRTDISQFQLTLSLPEGCPEGTCIYYTTSGKEPSKYDNLYTSPLTITQSTVVRAKLFCDGWLSPASTTHSYILFPRKLTLPVISISTEHNYLYHNDIGIFPNNNTDNRNEHNNWRRPINFEYFEGEGMKSALNQLCETRVGGGATREFSKKTMLIYAHKRFGEKLFDYEFFPDQKPGLHKFKSLSLRNAGNDFEYLYMRDALAQRSMGMYTDIDWQAWRPAIVYINGEYYGILNIRERAEEDNVYTNYDGLEDIDLFENWDNYKEGDWDNLNRFTQFYSEDNHTMAEYNQWMDCREFINIMIMNLYYCNLDFPGNNIVMWRPRTEGGRWRWIAKDVDYAMGLYSIPYTYETLKWFYNPDFDPYWRWNANGYQYTLLFRQLMKNQDFKNEFIDRYAIYTGDFLNYDGINQLRKAMDQKINYEFSYYGPLIGNGPELYQEEVSFVEEWVKGRTKEFTRQLCEFYSLESPYPLTINTASAENVVDTLMFNDHVLSHARYDGQFFRTRPIHLKAKPVEGKVIVGWQVRQTNGSEVDTKYYQGTDFTMVMPSCNQLAIEPQLKLLGDINVDDMLNQTDIDLLITAIMHQTTVDFDMNLYDLNRDGRIDAADLVKLISLINIKM